MTVRVRASEIMSRGLWEKYLKLTGASKDTPKDEILILSEGVAEELKLYTGSVVGPRK